MTIEEPMAVEQKWERIQVPDRLVIQSMAGFAHHLSNEVSDLVAAQPRCWLLKDSYDLQLSIYRSRVDFALGEINRALKILDDFSNVKLRLASIQNSIAFLRKWQVEKEKLMDEYQRNYVKGLVERLEIMRIGFSELADEKIEGLQEMVKEFERSTSILEPLRQSTHKWIPIKMGSVIVKPEYIPPGWSSKEPRKAQVREYVSRRKCERCMKEENVNSNSDLVF